MFMPYSTVNRTIIENLPGTNALAYFASSSVRTEKKVLKIRPHPRCPLI
jgi:hypothetical protein